MSTRGLCWCGLGRELHDGREMDAQGNMHRFNEPVRPQRSEPEVFEDPAPGQASHGTESVIPLLVNIKRLFDSSIVKMAQNGYKFPNSLVNDASRLSREISQILDQAKGKE
jgi:hypothetical protein